MFAGAGTDVTSTLSKPTTPLSLRANMRVDCRGGDSPPHWTIVGEMKEREGPGKCGGYTDPKDLQKSSVTFINTAHQP